MSAIHSFRPNIIVTAVRSCLPLLALIAVGCPEAKPPAEETPPEEVAAPARFADASDADIREAFLVSVGMSMMYAQLAQLSADFDSRVFDVEDDGCPGYEELGAAPLRVRYSGGEGCTTAMGVTYAGTAEATNPTLFEVEGDGGAMSAVYDGFLVDDGTSAYAIDGSWSQGASGIGNDARVEADLTVGVNGRDWIVRGAWDVAYEGDEARATCVDGLVGHVEDLGGFAVRCETVGFGTADSSGWVELTGQDVARVELTADADGCYPVTVEGVSRAPICPEEEEAPSEDGPLDGAVFSLLSTGSEDDAFAVFGLTEVGRVDRVDYVVALDRGAIEVHPLAFDAAQGTAEADAWSLRLDVGATYVPGAASALDERELGDAYSVFFAYDADDVLIGCAASGMDEDPGPIDVSACPRR